VLSFCLLIVCPTVAHTCSASYCARVHHLRNSNWKRHRILQCTNTVFLVLSYCIYTVRWTIQLSAEMLSIWYIIFVTDFNQVMNKRRSKDGEVNIRGQLTNWASGVKNCVYLKQRTSRSKCVLMNMNKDTCTVVMLVFTTKSSQFFKIVRSQTH